jgi:hypothetical protein
MLGSSQPPGLLLLQERPHDHGHGQAIERFQFFHFLSTHVCRFNSADFTTLNRNCQEAECVFFPSPTPILKVIDGQHVRVLTMMVNSDIIHLCTSLKKIFHGESIKLPEEVHHIIMLPIITTASPAPAAGGSCICLRARPPASSWPAPDCGPRTPCGAK